jgi:hypothetical protein
MAATIREVAHRVTTIAEAVAGTDDDHLRRGRSGPTSISQELYEVERTLGQAVPPGSRTRLTAPQGGAVSGRPGRRNPIGRLLGTQVAGTWPL